MKKRLPIFRAGKHRAENGRVYEFSEASVLAIAAGYDPALMQAPYVLGHPKSNAPAWGWAGTLSVEDGVLYSEHESVDPAFAEAVDAGRYRFRSAAFYAPDDAANPKPGQYYLRHVGFLGAQPPSIKGLGPAFADGDDGEFIAFAQADGFWVKDLFRGVRDWMIDRFDLETADKVLPTYAIDNIDRERDGLVYSEPDASAAAEALAAEKAALDARAAELDARAADLDQRDAARTAADQAAFAETARADDASFVDELVTAGKLPPGHADQVKTVLGVLSGDTGINFAEGEPDARAQLKTLLSSLGQVIHFGEHAPGEGLRFAEGRSAADHAAAITAVMAEHEAAGRPISAAQAASIARNR